MACSASSAACEGVGGGKGREEGAALKKDSTEGIAWEGGAAVEGRDMRGRLNAQPLSGASELDAIGRAKCLAQAHVSPRP